jgi:hypothetical protein
MGSPRPTTLTPNPPPRGYPAPRSRERRLAANGIPGSEKVNLLNLIKVLNFSGAGLRRHAARATREAGPDTRRAGRLLRPQSGAHLGRVPARHRGPDVPRLAAGRAVTKGQKGIRLVAPDTIDEFGTVRSIRPVYVFDVT